MVNIGKDLFSTEQKVKMQWIYKTKIKPVCAYPLQTKKHISLALAVSLEDSLAIYKTNHINTDMVQQNSTECISILGPGEGKFPLDLFIILS